MFFQEFHEMSHGLLLWLENIDRRRNEVVPVPLKADRETIRAHYETLTVRLCAERVLCAVVITVRSESHIRTKCWHQLVTVMSILCTYAGC